MSSREVEALFNGVLMELSRRQSTEDARKLAACEASTKRMPEYLRGQWMRWGMTADEDNKLA